jgi:ribosomal-protein-alanine N-acetyltransferase
MEIRTRRLELLAATAAMIRAEIHDRAEFGRLVQAEVPENWPPPLNDEASQQWTLRFLLSNPQSPGFGYWYLTLPEESRGSRILVGIAGFKGSPTAEGVVEIGYSVMEDRQQNGYGSEAASGLIAWAFEHPEVTQVLAETYPHLRPSIRVMERNGMSFLGAGSESGVIRYGISRKEYETSRPPQSSFDSR